MFSLPKSTIYGSFLACTILFTGCAALDAPIHDRYSYNECSLNDVSANSEPYHLRFEVVADANKNTLGTIALEQSTVLNAGAESLVFSGEQTDLQRGFAEQSQIWVLASLGTTTEGNACLKTRTATRPTGLASGKAIQETLLVEETYSIELVGACGESFLEAEIPGVDNAKLRISSAPQSTAEYLNNPESALNSSCAQMVESLPPEQGTQLRNDLKDALGV